MTSPAGSAGFTLLEMLVVLAIGGAAAVALVPARSGDAGALRQAERDLVRSLRSARATAIETGRPASLTLRSSTRGVALAGEPVVTFFPDGSASGGRLVLRGAAGERAVTIDWLTGAVSARS